MNLSIKWMLGAALFALATGAFANCGNSTAVCEKCADSEMGWNPDNKHVSEQLNRFYSLDNQIKAAYEGNDFPKATSLANEYLALAELYKCNWNYGNAIHDANQYLGLISLKAGDQTAAADYLIKAGKSSGSPQLDTFGPELDLADALLKAGQVEPVKSYLRDIKLFWEMDNGKIEEWLKLIDEGEKPELNRFSVKLSPIDILLGWLTLAWPAIVVLGYLYFRRRRIVRKWAFAAVGLIAGYVAGFGTSWLCSLLAPKVLSMLSTDNISMAMAIVYGGLVAYFLVSLLAVHGVAKFFLHKEPTAAEE